MRNNQRRGLTLIGFLLVFTMLLGVSIYVDSVSMDVWNEEMDIGAIAMLVHGENVENAVDEIAQVENVIAAQYTVDALAYLRMDTNEIYHGGLFPDFLVIGQSYSISPEYVQSFPEVFTFLEGGLPESDTDIALPIDIAEYADVGIGDMMNYSIELNVGKRPVYVCGLYIQETGNDVFDYYYKSVCLVTENLLNPDDLEYRVNVDIDRSGLTPYDPLGTLQHLREIERNIVRLDPGYPEQTTVPRFYVTDDLATGVENYLDWIAEHRVAQLTRAQAAILLGGLLLYLTTRYNIDDRKVEIQILVARGASNRFVHMRLLKEIVAISLLASMFGVLLGALTSRIAMASVDFMTISPTNILNQPFLVSLDTILLASIVAVAYPLLAYGTCTPFEKREDNVQQEPGRLARISRGLRLIRWDATLIIVATLFLLAIYMGGTATQENPNMILIQQLLPYPLFIGVSSLAIKTMKRLGEFLARVISGIVGSFPSSVGGRRASKTLGISGALLMMIVLTLCIATNSAVTATSLPQTELNHARFAIGGDVNLLLNDNFQYKWGNLDAYVRSHSGYEAASFLNVGNMYLSEGRQGRVKFVAIQPEEYSLVGYDFRGNELSESLLNESLAKVQTSWTSAIITENIALEYDLEIGDEMHCFGVGDTEVSTIFTIIEIVPALSSPIDPGTVRDWTSVGRSKVWVNKEFMDGLIDLYSSADTYYCIRTQSEFDGESLLADIISEMGSDILYIGRAASVTATMEAYLNQTLYPMDRAVDTLVSVLAFPLLLGGVLFYHAFCAKRTEHELRILRSLGATTKQLTMAHLSELLVLIMMSVLVFLLYGPIFIMNSIERAFAEYRNWTLVFPILIFINPVWTFTLPLIVGSVLLVIAISGVIFLLMQRRRSDTGISAISKQNIVHEELF